MKWIYLGTLNKMVGIQHSVIEKFRFQNIPVLKINQDEIRLIMKLIINFNNFINFDISFEEVKNTTLNLLKNTILNNKQFLTTKINWDFYDTPYFTDDFIADNIEANASDFLYINGFSIAIIPSNVHMTTATFIHEGYNFLNIILTKLLKINLFQIRNYTILLGIIATNKINSEILNNIKEYESLLLKTNFKRIPRSLTLITLPLLNIVDLKNLKDIFMNWRSS